jgi:ATP-dependent DNA helicase RecG
MDYMEEKGFGMRAWKSLNEIYGLPLPEYSFNDPFLTLTFARNLESVKNVFSHPNLAELNIEELKGYEYLKSKGELSKKEYASHFGFNEKKAQRQLIKMKDLGLVSDNGEKPRSIKFKYVIK